MADGADTKLPFVEQVHLIGADLFRAKLIRRTAEMFCERLYNFQVAVHGSLRVITTLELFQHLFTKLGHGDLLVTHKISRSEVEMLDRPTRVASAARAASFKRRSVDRGSANSQIVASTEGELRSNPGGARERYFVLSVAAAAGQLGCAKGVNLACGVVARQSASSLGSFLKGSRLMTRHEDDLELHRSEERRVGKE